jgi:hypothetical protein
MLIKTYRNFLSKENKTFINDVLLKPNFPYYLSDYGDLKIENNSSFKQMGHIVLKRKNNRNKDNIFNSPYSNETLSILQNLFIKAKIKKVEFFRIAYNYTFNNGNKNCAIHVDHEHNHQQAIIYLTDTLDKNTPTVLVNSKNKPLEKSYPEAGKGIIFKKHPHYQVFPKKGARLVLVATFKEIK